MLRGTRGGLVLVSDGLFAEASVFFIAGMVGLLGNLRMFTSVSWGIKTFKKIFRDEKDLPGGDDYVAYRQSRKRHEDAPVLLLIAAGLAALSLAVGLFA